MCYTAAAQRRVKQSHPVAMPGRNRTGMGWELERWPAGQHCKSGDRGINSPFGVSPWTSVELSLQCQCRVWSPVFVLKPKLWKTYSLEEILAPLTSTETLPLPSVGMRFHPRYAYSHVVSSPMLPHMRGMCSLHISAKPPHRSPSSVFFKTLPCRNADKKFDSGLAAGVLWSGSAHCFWCSLILYMRYCLWSYARIVSSLGQG